MATLKELNGRLMNQSYLCGYTPSHEDAARFDEMFGSNTAFAVWAAQMASYYPSERAAMLEAASATHTDPASMTNDDDDDDVDLFGEETAEEKAALAAKKAKDDAAKKSKKAVIAKSSILVDIKPWDNETDLSVLATKLRAVQRDGLLWGDNKLVPVAYGLKKLQQLIVIEDDKISGDDLEEIITGFEDYVQSMDIVAWNKV